MRILIINDLLTGGGAEVYVKNLKNILLDNGHNVKLIYFEKSKLNYISYEKDNNIKINSIGKNFLNKIFINPIIYILLKKVIKEFNPDKIILNNIFTAPITILKAIEGRETYQIVHDYSIVCCNGDCIKKDKSICLGYKYENCSRNCEHFASSFKIFFKKYNHKRVERIRKKNIILHISPSENLNSYLIKYGYNSLCLNNPIQICKHNSVKDYKYEKKYLYIGAINERKGIFEFIEAFNEFSKDKNVKLIIVGKADSEENEKKLNNLVNNNCKIEFKGYLKNIEARKILSNVFCLVVPSVWMENYPTVVLEGMASETLVIGSNRGGIPEMLENNRGIMFDIMNKNDIVNTLNYTFNIGENEYLTIIRNAERYLLKNNRYECYSDRIRKALEIK